MIELLRLFTAIALLRRGPQDLPASPLVLALTIVGFFVVQLVVGTVLPPIASHWLGNLLLEVAFTFGWYALLLFERLGLVWELNATGRSPAVARENARRISLVHRSG